MASNPSKVIPVIENMRQDWKIVDALMGGTKAMRAAGRTFLPQWPKEDPVAYSDRLQLSTLLPAYSETVKNMTGRVFAEPIVIGEDVPGEIAAYLENVDNQGNNLQVWAQSLFSKGLSHGLSFVLVDYPQTENLQTRADEIAAGARPYAVIIKPEQVLGWKYETVNGKPVLTQFRYVESVEEEDPDDEFANICIEQVRVLEPGYWRTYRQTGKDNGWEMHEEGFTTLDYVPIAVFYTNRTGFMTAVPPLLELAHLNIKHWQSQSDQDNILHVARVPILAIIGADQMSDPNAPAAETTVGSNMALYLPSGSDAKYVEHSGQAISTGKESLDALVEEMRMAGAKLLQKEKQATKTATQAREENAQETSALETMAGQLEDCLDQVLQIFADWLGLPEGGHVQVQGAFDVDFAQETTLPVLLNMAIQGRLSDETLFNEYKRRGIFAPELTWEDERLRIEAQGPELGGV